MAAFACGTPARDAVRRRPPACGRRAPVMDAGAVGRVRLAAATAAAAAAVLLSTTAPTAAAAGDVMAPHEVPVHTSSYVEARAPRLEVRWEQRSERSQVETYLLVSNATARTLDLMWVDYDGAERQYATIRAGETVVQPTYATHRWAVRDHTSDSIILFMEARPEAAVAVIGLAADNPAAAEHASAIVRDVTHHHHTTAMSN